MKPTSVKFAIRYILERMQTESYQVISSINAAGNSSSAVSVTETLVQKQILNTMKKNVHTNNSKH